MLRFAMKSSLHQRGQTYNASVKTEGARSSSRRRHTFGVDRHLAPSARRRHCRSLVQLVTGSAIRAALHTRRRTSGGTTQAASNSSLFAIVVGAPRAMDSAPIVIIDMYQVATIRARRTFLDMPRCCLGCRSGTVLNRTAPPIAGAVDAVARPRADAQPATCV